MLALDLLSIALAGAVDFRGEVSLVGTPVICIVARDAKGLQQGSELQEHLVLSTTKHLRQDFPCPMIDGMPQPPWLFLFTHKAPHFIDLCGLYPTNAYCHVAGTQAVDQGSIYRCEDRPFQFNS